MTIVTYEELAKLINGHNFEDKMTKYVMKVARDNNLVILSAIGNDTIELNGIIHDEIDLLHGGKIFMEEDGAYTRPGENRVVINSFWDGTKTCMWTFLTKIPHAKFTINKNNKRWCEGIVFKLDNLK